jgi:hypothetical protein
MTVEEFKNKHPRSEHEEQSAFFDAIKDMQGAYPHWGLIHAIPNGAKLPWTRNKQGKRYSRQAVILKAEGLRNGVCDVFCPFARGEYHGLYLEFKKKGNKPSPDQKVFIQGVLDQGYACAVVFSSHEALSELRKYEEL